MTRPRTEDGRERMDQGLARSAGSRAPGGWTRTRHALIGSIVTVDPTPVPPQICGEGSASAARHARESIARAAKFAGDISRESVRRAVVIAKAAPELRNEILLGTMTVNAVYRIVKNETRKPVYLTLPHWLEAEVAADAESRGVSPQAIIESVLAGWYDPDWEAS